MCYHRFSGKYSSVLSEARTLLIGHAAASFEMLKIFPRNFPFRLCTVFLLLVFAALQDPPATAGCSDKAASARQVSPSATARIIPRPRQSAVTQETFRLGPGTSIVLADPRSEDDRFAAQDFIDDVKETANVSLKKPYNRRLMFWGDIALNHPDLIGNVPKDMIVMNWQYGARDDYGASIKPFKEAGLDQFVCPGVWNWNQIFPNVEASSKNIINFVRDGQKAGAVGMMNTSWDDDGESLFEMTWYAAHTGRVWPGPPACGVQMKTTWRKHEHRSLSHQESNLRVG